VVLCDASIVFKGPEALAGLCLIQQRKCGWVGPIG